MEKIFGVCWSIISDCNMACPVCCRYEDDIKLTLADKYRIIDRIVESGIIRLNIAGGEPLLDKDIFDILLYAKSKGLITALSTNGHFITKDNLIKLSECIDDLQLPLDGPNTRVQQLVRGSDEHFELVVSKIKMLNGRSFPLHISTVVTKQNIDFLNEMTDILEKLKIDKWKLFHFVPVSFGYKNKSKFVIGIDEFNNAVRTILQKPLKFDFVYGVASQERLDSYFNISPSGDFYLVKGEGFQRIGNVLGSRSIQELANDGGFNYDFHNTRFWQIKSE